MNRSTSRPSSLGVADEIVGAQTILVVEQQVVHLPEGSLLGGGLGCFRGHLGARVNVAQRQVPPDVADVTEVAEELADDRFRLTAVGTLEVAVLDKRDGRLERPAKMVPFRIDLVVEVDERLRACRAGP